MSDKPPDHAAAPGSGGPAGRREPHREAALALDSVSKHFGGVHAVHQVTTSLARGERVGLIGPNGAGKTTLVKLVAGEEKPSEGRISFFGKDVTRLPVHARARVGLARTYQITELFFGLSVADNLRLATPARGETDGSWRDVAAHFHLQEVLAEQVTAIGYGQQRRLELAMALCQGPTVLLMDEPAAGLDSADRANVRTAIEDLSTDLTVLIIDHDVDLVMTVSDRVLCMANGRLIADGTPEEVAKDPEVRETYLGSGRSEGAA